MRLQGISIACFFPHAPFTTSGGWNRFTLLYRYLLLQGAHVTIPLFGRGDNCSFRDLSLQHAGSKSVFHDAVAYRELFEAAGQHSNLRDLSDPELQSVFMFDPGLYDVEGTLKPWLREIIRGVDIVLCEYPFFAQLLSPICSEEGRRLIITCHDCVHVLDGITPFSGDILKAQEVTSLRMADAVVFCSEGDREILRQYGIDGPVVPNVADVLSVVPGEHENRGRAFPELLGLISGRYCLFVGSDHGPNNMAAKLIRSRLAPALPDIDFVVAGSCHPSGRERNFLACGQIGDGDLDRLYRSALAVVIPLESGGGTSLKTFQALAYGVPVLSTRVGVRGLGVTAGKDVLICESIDQMVPLVSELRRNPGLRQDLARNGRRFAESWDFRTSFAPYAELISGFIPVRSHIQASAQRLVVVDNNLKDMIGHHVGYAKALQMECLKSGYEFQSLASKQADSEVLATLTARPVFTLGIHEQVPDNPFAQEWHLLHTVYDLSQGAMAFERELDQALQGQIATSDVIFIPNAMPHQVLGLALLLRRRPLYRQLQFILMFRYALDYPVGPISHRESRPHQARIDAFTYSFACLDQVSNSAHVRYCTDSDALAVDYIKVTQRPFEIFPIPHATSEDASRRPSPYVPIKDLDRTRIIFLGDAREEKGFELTVSLIDVILKAQALATVEFVVQAFVSSTVHREMAQQIKLLEQLRGPRVTLIPHALAENDYFALIRSADLVLLPYDAVTYRARTSGPFIEALANAKPVIVPDQTWMADQLASSGAGITFKSGDLESLSLAVLGAFQKLPSLTRAARDVSNNYKDFHNAKNMLHNYLLRTAGSGVAGKQR